jgi:dimethylargininase
VPTVVAVTRAVSGSFADCELTHLARAPIDVEVARRQHAEYERALERAGCRVVRLPEEPELPDSVFVEDTALVLDEVAVTLRPGALSRRGETASVAAALAKHRRIVEVRGPGTIDGGDVLRTGRTLRVGLSTRSDETGIAELRQRVAPFGYEVVGVPLAGCLHLKSAVTALSEREVLLNPEWVDRGSVTGLETIDVDPAEPFAANALAFGRRLIYADAFPRTAERLAARGFELDLVDLSEMAKAEGAVTCCSLIVRA